MKKVAKKRLSKHEEAGKELHKLVGQLCATYEMESFIFATVKGSDVGVNLYGNTPNLIGLTGTIKESLMDEVLKLKHKLKADMMGIPKKKVAKKAAKKVVAKKKSAPKKAAFMKYLEEV